MRCLISREIKKILREFKSDQNVWIRNREDIKGCDVLTSESHCRYYIRMYEYVVGNDNYYCFSSPIIPLLA